MTDVLVDVLRDRAELAPIPTSCGRTSCTGIDARRVSAPGDRGGRGGPRPRSPSQR